MDGGQKNQSSLPDSFMPDSLMPGISTPNPVATQYVATNIQREAYAGHKYNLESSLVDDMLPGESFPDAGPSRVISHAWKRGDN